jgi:uncharacterized membrane protein
MRDRSMDLDRVDRATLRAWRTGNLIGWWFVGTVVYHAIAVVLARTIVQKITLGSFGHSAPTPMLLLFLAILFSAATAGVIVGSRVYRSAFLVALLAVLLPEALFYLFAVTGGAIPELAILGLFSVVPALIAGFTARFVWHRRPRALRVAG